MVVLAMALSACTRPTQAWSSIIVSLTLFFLAISSLFACLKVGKGGAGWLGFAIFGWTYLIMGVGPRFECIESPMLTHAILKELFLRLVEPNTAPVMSDDQFFLTYRGRALEFFRIGHSCFTLLVGALGAAFGKLMDQRQTDDRS